jgi:hypothetical protein
MIDWIDEKLKAWGRAKWRIINSEGSPQSIMGRIVTYGPSAGDSQTGLQRFREGMTGDALDASIAIHRAMMLHALTDRQYEVGAFVFYACRGYSVRYKADALGISVHTLYKARDRVHHNLEPHFFNKN